MGALRIRIQKVGLLLALAATSLLSELTGCASSVAKADVTHEITVSARVASGDSTQVHVDAANDVNLLPVDADRFSQKIQKMIDSRKVANQAASNARNYEIDLHLTRYEKGNAFARVMLAGLGQIHIDRKITVYQLPDHTLVGEFDLAKTFAWGGIYGAATSMDDIENTYADGVAANVTGQKENPPKQKT
jgi:hypothetical protein